MGGGQVQLRPVRRPLRDIHNPVVLVACLFRL